MNSLLPLRPARAARSGLARLDHRVLQAEMVLGAALVALIFVLIPGNAVLRHFNSPLLWVDEFALQLMVWLAFLGASLGIATGQHMAIGLLAARLPSSGQYWLRLLCDILVLAFLAVMLWLVWRWFDPVGLWRSGMNGQELARRTFNYTYAEPSLTLPLRKLWFWLFVPLSLMGALIHALAALIADLRDGPGQGVWA